MPPRLQPLPGSRAELRELATTNGYTLREIAEHITSNGDPISYEGVRYIIQTSTAEGRAQRARARRLSTEQKYRTLLRRAERLETQTAIARALGDAQWARTNEILARANRLLANEELLRLKTKRNPG